MPRYIRPKLNTNMQRQCMDKAFDKAQRYMTLLLVDGRYDMARMQQSFLRKCKQFEMFPAQSKLHMVIIGSDVENPTLPDDFPDNITHVVLDVQHGNLGEWHDVIVKAKQIYLTQECSKAIYLDAKKDKEVEA